VSKRGSGQLNSSIIDVLCVIYHAKEELTRKVVVVSLLMNFLILCSIMGCACWRETAAVGNAVGSWLIYHCYSNPPSPPPHHP
jgi:hypothetical protein